MLTSVQDLEEILNSTGLSWSRDKAPKKAKYPYLIYSFVSRSKYYASGKVFKRISSYQVSLFTDGTEQDLSVIEKKFESKGISYLPFNSIQGDENNDTITNFFTYVRVVEDGQE
ncbi:MULTISPECIES: hypothetical protein [Jeotgalibaca]|uniref:hypothetical protein n=1 Tax=Jeotgalibaca TaxID=1470540 RepID=UPI0035A192CD